MGFFFRLFHVFDKNKPHKDLLEVYSQLNEIAAALAQNLKVLRQMQKEIIEARLERVKYTKKPTGAVALSKTEFIEEALIKELKNLAEAAEKRVFAIEKEIETTEPVEKEEREQLHMVLDYLNKIKNRVPDIVKIRTSPANEKLRMVETALREITTLSKEFYQAEKVIDQVARKVKEHEISALLKKIYLSPERLPQDPTFLMYKLTPAKLHALDDESRQINACQDPNYQIEWSRWWRDVQIPEADRTTPLKDPHINITIKLFGGPKKGVHLLLKAA